MGSKSQSRAACQTKASGIRDSTQPRKSLGMVQLSIRFVCHKVGRFCAGVENNEPRHLLPRVVPGYMFCYNHHGTAELVKSAYNQPPNLHMGFQGHYFSKNCSSAGCIKIISFSNKTEKFRFLLCIQCTLTY